jgi:hypothetical protein
MIQFINPISGSRITDIPGSKSVMLTPNYGSPIVSPYKGLVYNINNDSIIIQHSLNNQYVYSKFKGINRFQVGVNVPLKQGESFAYGDTTDIEYSILDENGKKMSVMPFFNGIDDGTNKKDDNKDDDNNKNKKGITPTIPGKSYTADFLTQLALKPFELIHNKIRPKTDEEKEESERKKEEARKKKEDEKNSKNQVTEEINRIKQLLK